ncbi:MAG TPA: SigE family RNA polymerase sigma factor [Marmoricola sp.]|nr:SigE family RNA polymerase sigma factor [Marmoricola sp.]
MLAALSRAQLDADAAVEQLYAGHYRQLVRLAVLLVRDRGTAEEVVQDAFVAMHGRWSRLRDPDNAVAYLRQAVVNRARSTLRHRGVVERHRPAPPADEPGADEAVLAADRRRQVLDALATLSTRQREVLTLRYFLDLSEQEIATTLGISAGSVKSHAFRGAAALRQILDPALEEER